MVSAGLDSILARRRLSQWPIIAAIGAIAALGQEPLGLWPATICALGLIFALIRKAASGKQALGVGWIAGAGYFAVALSWIVEPFLVDLARHGWMAPFALLGVSVGFGLFWAFVGWVTFKTKGQAAAFVGAFIFAEFVRGYALTGFPWAQLGHVLIDTAWLHLASYAGSLGLTALVLLGAIGVTGLIDGKWLFFAVMFGVLACLFGASVGLTPKAGATDQSPIIRIVHTNEMQQDRWDPDKIPVNFERKLEFTAGDDTGPPPALIVWPETSIPVLLERAQTALDAIAQDANGAPVIAGLQRFDGDGFFNSLIKLDGEGDVAAIYDKHHLVPFGEYLPFGDTFAKFGIFGLSDTTGGGYQPGPGPQVLDIEGLGTALPLICYEGVFPQDAGGYDKRPDFLMLITNDAWFGEISGPYQHLAQARLRSAEQGLPMIRSANTGISAMIDATGRITHQMGLDEAGWIDAPLPPALPATAYSRMGDWPIAAMAFVIVALGWFRARLWS